MGYVRDHRFITEKASLMSHLSIDTFRAGVETSVCFASLC